MSSYGDALEPGDGGEHLEALGGHLGPDSIARHDTELDQSTLRDIPIPIEPRRQPRPIVTAGDRAVDEDTWP